MTAIHLAKKLAKENKVGVIVFTIALRNFLKAAIDNNTVNIFSPGWDDYFNQEYDFLILDEVQDLTLSEIKKPIAIAKKGIYFFGDDSQQIYDFDKKKRTTIEDIKNETGFSIIELTQNIRLSKPINNFLKDVLPVFNFGESSYNNSNIVLPIVEHFDSIHEEQAYIAGIITNKLQGATAIILSKNEQVREYYAYLKKNIGSIQLEYKDERRDGLTFVEGTSVNVLTFHSAKGLEFDNVILPDAGHENEKCMYVGCTRAKENLILTDNGNGFYDIGLSNLYNSESHEKYVRIWKINEEIAELLEKYALDPINITFPEQEIISLKDEQAKLLKKRITFKIAP